MLQRLEGKAGFQPHLTSPDKAKAGLARTIVTAVQVWRQLYGEFPLPQAVPTETTMEASVGVSKISPEFSLKKEFDRQVESMVELAAALEIDREKCLRQLPSGFPERKPSYERLAIDVPLLVPQFPGVPWLEVVGAANFEISDYLREKADNLSVWQDHQGTVLPEGIYATWAHVGDRYWNRKPSDVRKSLLKEERGGTHWDGLGLARSRPNLINNKWFDLVGSQVGSDEVPYVFWWRGRPMFDADLAGDAFPRDRALVCGR